MNRVFSYGFKTIPLIALPETVEWFFTSHLIFLALTLLVYFVGRNPWGAALMILYLTGNIICSINMRGAFSAFLPVAYLFYIFFRNSQSHADAARYTLAAIFLGSVIFKANSAYFAGGEFLPNGDLYQWSRASHSILISYFSAFPRVSALVSLVLEFLVGILLLVNPAWGALAVIVFILSVQFVGAGGVVYFCLLSLLVCFQKNIQDRLYSLPYRKWLLPLLVAAVDFVTVLADYYLSILVLVLFAAWLFKGSLRFSALVDVKPLRSVKVLVSSWLFLFISYQIAALVGLLPVPLGFSMFASRNSGHRLYIKGVDACYKLSQVMSGRFDHRFVQIPPSEESGACFYSYFYKVTGPIAEKEICKALSCNATVRYPKENGDEAWEPCRCLSLASQ